MKKNFYPILLLLVLLALLLKRNSLPGGGLVLIITAGALAIGYFVKGVRYVRTGSFSDEIRTFTMATCFYLAFTLIGLMFRHQWWPFPFYDLAFHIFWPLATISVIVQLIRFYIISGKHLPSKQKRVLTKELIVPFYMVTLLAIPSFLFTTEWFCKIYKPYTFEEINGRWTEEKN